MSYETDLDGVGVIDDSNYNEYIQEINELSGPFGSGLQERDFDKHGVGSYCPTYRGNVFPRSQWDDLIKAQDDNHTSPWHHHKASTVPILNQNGYPYCWCFGTVAGVLNAYAKNGIQVPHLSATGPAAQGKNYRQQGGWAGEAIKYIKKYGIPTVDTWPEKSLDRRLAQNDAQRKDAARHGIVEFEELPQKSFDHAASVLLDPINPSAITLALMWWGHLVCGLRLVKVGGRYGILIVNSWGSNWGEAGYKVLLESKSTAHEQIAVRNVKLRAA